MRRGILKDSKPGLQIFFVLLTVLASWVIFQLLSMLSAMLFYDLTLVDISSAMSNLEDPVIIGFLKYVQAITSIGMFIVASLIISWFISEHPMRFLELDRHKGIAITLLVILLMIFSLPMNNFLTYLNQSLKLPEGLSWLQEYFIEQETSMEKVMERFLRPENSLSLFVNLFVIAIIPAIGEEMLFRGIIQKIFIRWFGNIHTGILVTALLFGVLHFQFLSLLPRFVLGIIIGYLFVWTRTLWMPILAHFIVNATAVVFYHFHYSDLIGLEMETVGTPESHLSYAFLSLTFVVITLFVIRRVMKEKNKDVRPSI